MSKASQGSVRFADSFLAEVAEIAKRLDAESIERAAALLATVRERGGRLFIIGVGGSAANASHAVNDFRKLTGMEAYSPTDNVSELTARINDEGWPSVFAAWLETSRLQPRDAVLVFSVGAGSIGVVGRDGGHTARVADVSVLIPIAHPDRITPHTEAFQSVVWHLLVSHPSLQRMAGRWESITQPLRQAVFLDRDGVLNEPVVRNGKPYPPASAAELQIIPNTAAALARLKEREFLLLVVTNQPDVARGTQKREVVEEIGRRLQTELPLDDILTCFHDDQDACDCRKPRPGLLLRAASQYGIDLRRSYLAGDRWRDIDAGANAGCRTIWIDRGYNERPPSSVPDARVASLPEAVDWILKNDNPLPGGEGAATAATLTPRVRVQDC